MFKFKLTWVLIAAISLIAVLTGSAMADPPDTTPPTVMWQNTDMSGVVVNGRTMTVSASDDTAVTAVEFDIDGVLYATATDNGDGTWSAEFDTANWDEGPVTIDAIASDAAGNQSELASISFVDSHDTDQPVINSVTIGSTTLLPAEWAQLPPSYIPAVMPTISGATHFVVNADDDHAVTSVLYSTDAESTWHPMTHLSGRDWSVTVDAETLAGTGVLFLQLADAAGNNVIDAIGLNAQTAPQLVTNLFEIGNDSNADPNAIPQVGNYLGVSGGNATGNPTPTISYAWTICHGGTCTTASGPEYIVQASDVGADISVTVIADNGIGQPATLPHDFGIAVAAPVVDDQNDGGAGEPPVDTTPPAFQPSAVEPPVGPPVLSLPSAGGTPEISKAIVDAKTEVDKAQNALSSEKRAYTKTVATRKAEAKKAAAAKESVAEAKADLQRGTATPAEQKRLKAAKADLLLAQKKQSELLKLEAAKKKAVDDKKKQLDAKKLAEAKLLKGVTG